jgi:hypothetical protein
MKSSRRTFLKTGALGALVLAAGGVAYRTMHPPTLRPYALDGEARAVLHAVIPVILDGALPGPLERELAILQATERVQAAILGLPLATQKEVQDLFGLLALAPARRLLTGVADGWAGADSAQVARFLADWRVHRVGLLRSAYGALHDLVLGSWYADPSSWAAIGYPGPNPQLA